MSDSLSGEQMQAKINAARRDAEGLKDRIKRKKDELADTSRMLPPSLILGPASMYPCKGLPVLLYVTRLFMIIALLIQLHCSLACCSE